VSAGLTFNTPEDAALVALADDNKNVSVDLLIKTHDAAYAVWRENDRVFTCLIHGARGDTDATAFWVKTSREAMRVSQRAARLVSFDPRGH
jgi:hypothetical protein